MKKVRIYKYLTPDRIDVLVNRSIRFTQANLLNDPFESLPFIDKIMNETNESLFYDALVRPIIEQLGDGRLPIDDIPWEYRTQIPTKELENISEFSMDEALKLFPAFHPREMSKILFTSSGEELDLNLASKLKDSWAKIFGILSLTISNTNITMWSHYARNHTGFVIEFDSDNKMFNQKLSEVDPFRVLKPVQYSKNRPDLELIRFDLSEESYISQFANKVLYTKSQEWSYEDEYRLVYDLREHNRKLTSDEGDIYLFDFNPDAIKSIYFGVNSSSQFKELVLSVLANNEYSHVKIYYSRLNKKEYAIEFHGESSL